MSKLRNISTSPSAWLCIAVIFGALYFLGDMYYDFVLTPKAAEKLCGERNIEFVSMQGFYKRKIDCFSLDVMP